MKRINKDMNNGKNGRTSTLSSPRCSFYSLIRSAPRPRNVELSYALIALLPFGHGGPLPAVRLTKNARTLDLK